MLVAAQLMAVQVERSQNKRPTAWRSPGWLRASSELLYLPDVTIPADALFVGGLRLRRRGGGTEAAAGRLPRAPHASRPALGRGGDARVIYHIDTDVGVDDALALVLAQRL